MKFQIGILRKAAAFAAPFFAMSCMKDNHAATSGEALQIEVLEDGEVIANGQRVDLDRLSKLLEEQQAAGGAVWYYRENPEAAEPPENAMRVLGLIVEFRLPVCLSPTPDFANCKASVEQ